MFCEQRLQPPLPGDDGADQAAGESAPAEPEPGLGLPEGAAHDPVSEMPAHVPADVIGEAQAEIDQFEIIN